MNTFNPTIPNACAAPDGPRAPGDVPRPEYPRPQFIRREWLCLNGKWQFERDAGDTGLERGLRGRDLKDEIVVPFCPEAELSGVGDTDVLNAVWYRRTVEIPEAWRGQRVLLHFQACDYDTTVWIENHSNPLDKRPQPEDDLSSNDAADDATSAAAPAKSKPPSPYAEVTRHRGGFTPFAANLENLVDGGDRITIIVRARDRVTTPQPRGKQSQRHGNYGCLYTRTTGIWQTVWLEPVPHVALRRPHWTPDVANGLFILDQRIENSRPGLKVRATLRDEAGEVCRGECATGHNWDVKLYLPIPAARRRLWGPGDPHLYAATIELVDQNGGVVDAAESYCGLRGIALDGKAIRLNGEVVFQRWHLDQGYYPDGIMTAPSDEALVRDIELSFAAGFNGARLHQKVFEERFFYHADRLGYLCWSEFADWGCRHRSVDNNAQFHAITFAAQWAEALHRDYSHPSIIGWCPLNETHQPITDEITDLDDAARALYLTTKAMDSTRPVLDASGYSHRVPETDIYDAHDYQQNPIKFARNHRRLAHGRPHLNGPKDRPWSIVYRDQPFFVSEFGGIHWNPAAERIEGSTAWIQVAQAGASWGYGASPHTLDEFYARFDGLCGVLLDNPEMFGYCYTQLTDVFQEENGLYNFDRSEKFEMEQIYAAQARRAAIEEKFGSKYRLDRGRERRGARGVLTMEYS